MVSRLAASKFAQRYIPNKIVNASKNLKLQFPEKYKGTLLEKWANYWKNLYIDYKEVVIETVENAHQKPTKAFIICSGLGFLAYCAHSNPDERTFRDKFLVHSNEMALVGEPIRNPETVEYLMFLEKCYNAGVVRRLSLCIISFIWLSDYGKLSGLYQAHCDYLEPKVLTFNERIVDVGFFGQWWILERKMKDFDINPLEFKHKNE